MRNKHILVLFLFFLIFFPLIRSVPPSSTTINFESGYIIIDSPQYVIKQNSDFIVNFFVYNRSNGANINPLDVSCMYYLSNNSGNLIYNGYPTFNDTLGYWSLLVKGGNFSNTGNYFYGIRCNSTSYGGEISGEYLVNISGNELTINDSLIILIILLSLIAIAWIISNIGLKLSESSAFGLLFVGISLIIGIIAVQYGVLSAEELISSKFYNIHSGVLVASLIVVSFIFLIYMLNLLFGAISKLTQLNKIKKYGSDYNPEKDSYE